MMTLGAIYSKPSKTCVAHVENAYSSSISPLFCQMAVRLKKTTVHSRRLKKIVPSGDRIINSW
jgi:hypothetical protein